MSLDKAIVITLSNLQLEGGLGAFKRFVFCFFHVKT